MRKARKEATKMPVAENIDDTFERVLKATSEKIPKPLKPIEDIEKELKELVRDAIDISSDYSRKNNTAPAETVKHITFSSGTISAQIERIEKNYKKATIINEALIDTKKQMERADAWDKVRLLIFRIATAISIAAVILGTSMAADALDVNLPFRMGALK